MFETYRPSFDIVHYFDLISRVAHIDTGNIVVSERRVDHLQGEGSQLIRVLKQHLMLVDLIGNLYGVSLRIRK